MITRDFIVAGNATFTVEIDPRFAADHDLPSHYTYRVKRSKPSERYPDPAYFVSLLVGPDNTSDYAYVGKLDPSTGNVTTTRASRCASNSAPMTILRRVLGAIWEGRSDEIIDHGWDVHHEGRCGRCGRKLTVPESVKTGIGPECASREAYA